MNQDAHPDQDTDYQSDDPQLESPPHKRSRMRRFGGAVRRILTPTPEEPQAPVPPTIKEKTPQLLNKSPFVLGFLGALGVLVALALADALVTIRSILVLVVLALFLALGLSPAVDALTRRRVPRTVAVSIIAATAFSVITAGIWSIVPILTEQATRLTANLPRLINNLAAQPQITRWDERFNFVGRLRAFVTSDSLMDTLFGGIMGAGQALANVVYSVIVTLVLTIYFLASMARIKSSIYSLAPASRRPRVKYLADEIFRGISGYLIGMFVVVTVASVCAYIFLNIIGLGSYALALSFVVAMLCFIPVVGSFVAMGIVSLVAFATNQTMGIATVIYFLVYTQFDAYVIYPNVMKRTVKVPGALVVLSALIGGMLLGIIGVIIAIPTTAALLLLYREIVRPILDAA